MSKPKVSVSQINIIAKNHDATLRFYRMVVLDIPSSVFSRARSTQSLGVRNTT